MIDVHCHILPGVDDGVRTLAEAVELAAAAAANGVTHIVATPHVRRDYPTTAERMEAGVEEVRTALREAGVDCEVLPGGEVDLIELAHRDDAELLRLTLGGRGRCLLVEFPDDGWPPALESTIARLSALGVQTLLAHPERNSAVQERPALLRGALELGALVQVTAASVDGRLGRRAAATSRRLIREGFAHVLATDSHHPGLHREGVAAAAAEVGDAALVEHMTVHAPRALLGEGAMPPLPRVRRRRLPFNLSGN